MATPLDILEPQDIINLALKDAGIVGVGLALGGLVYGLGCIVDTVERVFRPAFITRRMR